MLVGKIYQLSFGLEIKIKSLWIKKNRMKSIVFILLGYKFEIIIVF